MSLQHPEAGVRIGDRYVLTERIATGGMGEVWCAQDDVLGREVAVKLLRREYAADPMFVERFRAEARHAASLTHPGIASVYDFGEAGDSGITYLVMEFVPGEPLSTRIHREGALPAATAVPLIQQAAAALQAAHDGGLVHRDIKPANLLITPDDQVKITDFGIARAGDQAPITRTGEVMGTAQYLSPEQAMGQSATGVSDVYALGVVAYESLTGRRPFDGDSVVATAMAQVNDAPAPLPASVPGPVARVVMQALAKAPENRPASAAQFGSALGAALAADASDDNATALLAPTGASPWAGAAAAGMAGPAATAAMGAVPPATPASTGAAAADAPGNRRALWWVVLGLAVLIALIAFAATQLGPDDPGGVTDQQNSTASTPTTGQTTSNAPSTTSSTSSDTPSQSPTDTPTDETITLSPADYIGRDATEVAKELRDLDLKVKQDKVKDSGADKGTVLSLSPTAGLHPGDTVTLGVADGPKDDGGDAGGDDGGGDGGDGDGDGAGQPTGGTSSRTTGPSSTTTSTAP